MKTIFPALLLCLLLSGCGLSVADRMAAEQNANAAQMTQRAINYQAEKKAAREKYVADHPELEQPIKDAILANHIVIGMSEADVVASFGEPERRNQTVTANGVSDQWVYGRNYYVYFQDGRLTSWQNETSTY